MLHVALSVDRNGLLNACSLDPDAGFTWTGPHVVGAACLVPGSPVTVFQQSASVIGALLIDRHGVLNAATLDLTQTVGWQGLATVGNGNLVPGSAVSLLKVGATEFCALAVDRDGVLNVATLDATSTGGWQGMHTVGGAVLEPGSNVTAIQTSSTVFVALAVDETGALNAATLDTSNGEGWQGPDTVVNGALPPGSRVYAI
jgi:hypothetical protein